jgi:hypothetical protein
MYGVIKICDIMTSVLSFMTVHLVIKDSTETDNLI